jgi:NADH:ubiquinone oxidoreductase subunit F (NADH-binding)
MNGKNFFDKPWNIFSMSHAWFVLGIKSGLLTLNMGLAKNVFKSSMVWVFESKKKLKDAFYHPSCNQCSKCLRLLNNNYNIFKNVEMGGLEKYLMKINFSKYINYLTNMCWNGQSITILYINIHHFRMIEKLQSGEKTFGL